MRLWMLLVLLLSGSVLAWAPVDLKVSQPWLLSRTPTVSVSLGMTAEQLGCTADEDLVNLENGLAVRFRAGHAVNFIAAGEQSVTLAGTLVCQNGEKVDVLNARLGPPQARFVKPNFINTEMWYYRGAMADMGTLVQDGEVKSFLLTEPGMLEPTLIVAGYQRLP